MCEIKITFVVQSAHPFDAGIPFDVANSHVLMDLQIRNHSLVTWSCVCRSLRTVRRLEGSFQRSQLERMNHFAIGLCVRARGETNDPIDSSSQCTSNGIAFGTWIGRGSCRNGPDALGHHLAIKCHRISTRPYPLDVVCKIWRLIPRDSFCRWRGPDLRISL